MCVSQPTRRDEITLLGIFETLVGRSSALSCRVFRSIYVRLASSSNRTHHVVKLLSSLLLAMIPKPALYINAVHQIKLLHPRSIKYSYSDCLLQRDPMENLASIRRSFHGFSAIPTRDTSDYLPATVIHSTREEGCWDQKSSSLSCAKLLRQVSFFFSREGKRAVAK